MTDAENGDADDEPVARAVRRAIHDVALRLVAMAILAFVGLVGLALLLMTARSIVTTRVSPLTLVAGVFGVAALVFAGYELRGLGNGSSP